MRKIAETQSGECLSMEYINARTKLRWRCSEGHEWDAVSQHIKEGHWCPHCANNAMLSIEKMRKIAKSRGGECFSMEYINARTKLRWRCSEGHEWEAVPDSVKRRSWCPTCSLGVSERICRATFEHIFSKKFPKRRPEWLTNPKTNFKLELDGYCEEIGIAFEFQGDQHYQKNPFFHISRSLEETQYIDQLKKKLCKEHGVTLIEVPSMDYDKFGSFIMAKCREQSIAIGPLSIEAFDYKSFDIYSPFILEEMKRIADSRNGECLSDKYVNSETKLRWRCNEGHEWEATPKMVKSGTWCRICGIVKGAMKQRDTIENMRIIAMSHDGECLSDQYVNDKTKLKWRCSEGHEWKAVPSSVKQGHWCPVCARRK